MTEENALQVLIDIINYFHSLDLGRCSIFNPIVKDKEIGDRITLSIVEDNLKNGLYTSNYWNFIKDVTKCFEYIHDNFISRSPIYKLALDCKQQFDKKIDKFMKNQGYCCGTYHIRKSRKIQCSGSRKCYVKSNSAYYRYNSWAFCEKCLKKLPNTGINLDDNVLIDKADFKFCFFIDEEPEDFVECIKCKKLLHERCVLHIKQSGVKFFCAKCRGTIAGLKEINISSEQIPKTECDSYIENFLKQHNIPNCDNIVVRLVSNVPTDFRTKPLIAKYHNENFGHEISYNNCVIFVFLKLSDGTEICFFGIYFQLYGDSKCPEPNKNSVYLSYIDSVKLSIVKERTKVYQYILLGLFSYLKMKKFRRVFIWSCPPKRDVDYIFHEKPSEMKMPTKARLSEWYKTLMQLAVDEQIAMSFCGIKKFADDENWNDINNIPYMDSDMWPIRLEEAIFAAEKEALKNSSDVIEKINELMEVQKLGFDNQYFVLHFSINSTIAVAQLPEITKGNWINNRSDLVDMFWENKLEYSNERLAKFSTKVLLYRMFIDDAHCTNCGKSSNFGVNLSLQCNSCVSGKPMQIDQHQSIESSEEAQYFENSERTSSAASLDTTIELTDTQELDMIEIIDSDDVEMSDEIFIDLTFSRNRLRYSDLLDLTNDDSEYEIIEPIQYGQIDLCG